MQAFTSSQVIPASSGAEFIPAETEGPPPLPFDVLVFIAQKVLAKSDLAASRLASKDTRDAVGQALQALEPSKTLLAPQLSQLCHSFPHLTTLDLTNCLLLSEESLDTLATLAGTSGHDLQKHDPPPLPHTLTPPRTLFSNLIRDCAGF